MATTFCLPSVCKHCEGDSLSYSCLPHNVRFPQNDGQAGSKTWAYFHLPSLLSFLEINNQIRRSKKIFWVWIWSKRSKQPHKQANLKIRENLKLKQNMDTATGNWVEMKSLSPQTIVHWPDPLLGAINIKNEGDQEFLNLVSMILYECSS